MKKIASDYKSVDKMNAQQQKKPLGSQGKHLSYAAGKVSLNTLTAQDKIMHRKESNKRIIINDSDKRKTETLKKAKQQLEQVILKEERKEVGNMAFITKKGEIEEDLDLLSDIDDEQFEADLDLSLETKTKIMQEEMDRKAAQEDLDKQQRELLKGIVDKKKRLGSAIQRQPILTTTNTRLACPEESKHQNDMDSSLDSEEFDAEMRDKVKAEGTQDDSPDEDEDKFTNTDMKYYNIMDPVDKLNTLSNRTKTLQAK